MGTLHVGCFLEVARSMSPLVNSNWAIPSQDHVHGKEAVNHDLGIGFAGQNLSKPRVPGRGLFAWIVIRFTSDCRMLP